MRCHTYVSPALRAASHKAEFFKNRQRHLCLNFVNVMDTKQKIGAQHKHQIQRNLSVSSLVAVHPGFLFRRFYGTLPFKINYF